MSPQNNEFEIPFDLSRRGKKEEIGTKSIGRRIGSLAASRMIDRPNLGGKRRSGRGLGIPDGDLNPLTRVDKNRNGILFDNWPGWEQPDPTPSSPGSLNNPLSLSSGANSKPSFPRKPTYGPFIGSAEKKFGKAKTWEELKEIYDNTEVIFFDYETTGLVFDDFREPSSNGLPVQFGAVKMKGGKEIARLNIFMNPNEPLGEWSRNNLKDKDGNPLTDNWLATQPSMADAHKALVDFAGEDAIFGVQNAAFDKDVLEKTLSDAGIDWRPGGYLDTKDIADMTLPKWSQENQDGPFIVGSDGSKKPSNGLAAITKYLEVDLGEKHHTADADAQATGLVMSAIVDGAIERDWPTNLLDSDKRKNKLKADNDKFDAEIKKFRSAKESFIESAKEKESPSLASGLKERPIIKMPQRPNRPTITFEKNQRDLLKKHRSMDYKYGDESVLGGTISASKNDWLKGLTGKQIANLIVPDSEDEHFRMWVDDIAPGAYEVPNVLTAFRKYYDEMLESMPWDRLDYSPENVAASKEAVQAVLDSSPAVRWAFENHGAPSIGVMSKDAIDKYESIPSINQLLNELQESRGFEKRPFVRAKLSPASNLLLFNKRALIDREESSSDKKTKLLWSDTHMPLPSDAHIDKSIAGTMVHEWGHWLNFRAVKDTENTKKNRLNFFGSGDINDDNYINALGLAEYYRQTEKDQALMDLWDNEVPIDETNDVPRVITSYGHVNPAETFAEGMVAYLHPNPEVRKKAINEKLRKDIESFLGDGTEKRPWDEHEALDIALSSGRTKEQKIKRRTANTSASEQAFSRDKNRISEPMGEAEYSDNNISLASGSKYEQLVRNQPRPSPEQVESSNNFKDLIRMSELRTVDKYVVTGQDAFGDDEEEIIDSEDRVNLKNDIKNNLEKLFSNEIKLSKPIIVESSSGELINLGDRIKVTALARKVTVETLSEEDMSSQASEIGEFLFDGKKPVTLIDIGLKITPTDEDAVKKLIQSGVPTDLIEVDSPDSLISLAFATRQIASDGDKIVVGHESIFVGKEARKYGIASAVNARNESIYAQIGADSIFTMAASSDLDQQGATHWARNGFTWMGEPSKQKFIKVIDDAISNNPELFSDEERERISRLYKKQGETFKSSASAEELIDFAAADELFKNVNEGQGVTIYFKREIAKPSGISALKNRLKRRTEKESASLSLSSGGDPTKFRKVGPYRMKKHDKGHWESEDGFHFRQSSPPNNLWDVYENEDPYSDAVYESDTGNLQRAVAQFRKSQTEENSNSLSSGAMVPLSPDTTWPPPAENGYGAMPGDPTNRVIKMVPISTVRKYLEFDRENSAGGSKEQIKKIEEELRSGRGIREALQLFVSIDDNWAYLGEGNHRLIAAEKAGLTHVPVTVEIDESSTKTSSNKKKGIGAPLSLIHPKMWQFYEQYNHLPSRATPGVFAELQDDEDRRLMAEWKSNSNTDKWRISSEAGPSLSSGADDDYRMLHGAPGRGSGAPLHDLISPEYAVYPEDVYTSNAVRYYGVGNDNLDAMAFNLIRSFRGKPEAEVTIYRAVPRSTSNQIAKLEKQLARYMSRGKIPDGIDQGIEPSVWSQSVRDEIERLKKLPPNKAGVTNGDWVTPFRQYAVDHGDGALGGDYEIVKKRVKAKNVYTAGDSWLEWGFDDSKGSLSLSSGAQPNINLSESEKREIILLASQRTDRFSQSVVEQYRRNNGRLSNKQWAALNRMTSRGGLSLSSGALMDDPSIRERIEKSFERASLPESPSTPKEERLLSKLVAGIKKKDGSPVTIDDFMGFLDSIAWRSEQPDRLPHPGFNNFEENVIPIESVMELFKELGLSRVAVPGSNTKKILGPVIPELADLVGDDEWLQEARDYVLPPLEVWSKAAAKSILGKQRVQDALGETIQQFEARRFKKKVMGRYEFLVVEDAQGNYIMRLDLAKATRHDAAALQDARLGEALFGLHQKTPGVPFLAMVKRHMYPDDPQHVIQADPHVISANNDAVTGGRNIAESIDYSQLTPLDSLDFANSPAGKHVEEMFRRAYANIAHNDEFARRYAVRVRTLLSEAGLDPDSPAVKRAVTIGWSSIADSTEEPAERGGRFVSAALLVRNLLVGLYRPSWDVSGESYTTPHEFMHLITGQGFTRHGEMASNLGWLGAFGEDVWPVVSNLLTVQSRFFNMQLDDEFKKTLPSPQPGDKIEFVDTRQEANRMFKSLVLNEIRELLGGEGDDYGQTSQKLMEKLYKDGGVLSERDIYTLFADFNWVSTHVPLEAGDLGWGATRTGVNENGELSLSSGARTTGQKMSQGPASLSFGRDNDGLPLIGSTAELKRKFGNSSRKIEKHFKQKHNIDVSVKMPKDKDTGEVEALYGALQALDDLFGNSDIQDILKDRRFSVNLRGTKFAEKKAGLGRADEQGDVPLGSLRVNLKRKGVVLTVIHERVEIQSKKIKEKILKQKDGITNASKFRDMGQGVTYSVLEKFKYAEASGSTTEEISKRIAYAVAVHEFGHLLDHVARLNVLEQMDLPSRRGLTLENVDEYLKKARKAMYLSSYLEDTDEDWERASSVTRYGTVNSAEKMAEAFAAWWLFSRVETGRILTDSFNPKTGASVGRDVDAALTARAILEPLFDALDDRFKQMPTADTNESDEVVDSIETKDVPPVVELFGIMPFIEIIEQEKGDDK